MTMPPLSRVQPAAFALILFSQTVWAENSPLSQTDNDSSHWLLIAVSILLSITAVAVFAVVWTNAKRLKKTQSKLTLSHSNLEKRVHQRTLDLETEIIQRNRIELALKESEARVRAVVDNVLDGIITINEKGVIQTFNPAAEKVFGYAASEVIGKNVSMLMPSPHREKHDSYMQNYHKTGDAKIIGIGRETQGQHKDGSVFPLDLAVNEFSIEEQRFYSGIVRDITEKKQAAAALIQAKDEAEDANKAKSEFLSSMSHELRTPLNAILGFSQLLEMENITVEQKDVVHEILKAGSHLLDLINEILDLSRIESGNIDLSIEPVDLKSVFNECISLITPLAKERKVKLNFTQPLADAPILRADRIRLKQVILNLLSNAVKYNRINGEVSVAISPGEENFIRISISDNGPGISESRIKELFQPFNRLGAEHTGIEGNGIGLVITKHLLELMGGTLGMESEMENGSTFWFELPQDTQTHTEATPMLLEEDYVPADDPTHHTIIYIEDNPTNLKLVSQLLAHRNAITLYTAHTAELGLKLVHTHKPELILLDINLPGMNGYDVLKQLQQVPETSTIPVVAISANAMPQDIQKGLHSGFTDYLTKPLDVGQFFQALDRLLTPKEELRTED